MKTPRKKLLKQFGVWNKVIAERRKKNHENALVRGFGFKATKEEFRAMGAERPMVLGGNETHLFLHDRRPGRKGKNSGQ